MDNEMEELVTRYLDGVATPPETEKLDDRLQRDPETRRLLLNAAALDVQLRFVLEAERVWEAGEAGLAPEGTSAEPEVSRRPDELQKGRPGLRIWMRGYWRTAVGVAAGVCLVVGAYAYRARMAREATAGSSAGKAEWASSRSVEGNLVSLAGPVSWAAAEGMPARVCRTGDLVRCDQTICTGPEAFAEVKYPSGSTLRVCKNTTAAFDRTNGVSQVTMTAGALVCRIQSGHKMSLLTPHVMARVVGTKFKLLVDTESSWLGVEEGQMEMTRRSDGKEVLVHAGRYSAVLESRHVMLTDVPLQCPWWQGRCAALIGTEANAERGVQSAVVQTSSAAGAFKDPILDRMPFTALQKTEVQKIYATYQQNMQETIQWWMDERQKGHDVLQEYMGKHKKNAETFQTVLFALLDEKQKELYTQAEATAKESQAEMQKVLCQYKNNIQDADCQAKLQALYAGMIAKLDRLFAGTDKGLTTEKEGGSAR